MLYFLPIVYSLILQVLPIILLRATYASLCCKNLTKLQNTTDKHKFKLNTNESYTATLKMFLYNIPGNSVIDH